MDSFEVSFDQNAGDAHSFVDYFQQQQEQQAAAAAVNAQPHGGMLSASHPSSSTSSSSGRSNHSPDPRAAAASAHGGLGVGAAGKLPSSASDDDSSPNAAAAGAEAPQQQQQGFASVQADSGSASFDSPGSSSLQQAMPSSTTTTSTKTPSNSKTSASVKAALTSLHPNVATPVRHNSLPFEQQSSLSPGDHQSSLQRPLAGPRQLSMNAISSSSASHSHPNSPSLQTAMRPPFQPSNFSHNGPDARGGAMSSPVGPADYLNPNAPTSSSPSPLRASSMTFTSSPDSTTTSPTVIKAEDHLVGGSRHSPMVPSQPQGGAGGAGNSSGGMNSADSQAASTKFVYKLFRMVSDPEYQHLISWNANGTSVVVTNFDEFAKEVLGKHFKHSNFSSFIRQLNMYGFYKVNKTPRGHRHTVDTQVWEFSHPKFLRGRPDLLDDIRRKALDSEHARVEARDLQYTVSVGHMQLRQQVDEQQYRMEEMFEMNMALRQMVLGLRDSLGNVLEWIKANHGGQLPFDARLPKPELPPAPIIHPFMAERPPPPPWGAGMSPNPMASAAAAAAAAAAGGAHPMMGQADMMGNMSGDGPSIFVTEPGFGPPHSSHDVFSMGAMGQVSPMASRRVSAGSQASERMDMPNGAGPPRMSIDTALAASMTSGNPGLGVMGLSNHMNGEMQMAINTPLPPSPAVPSGHHLAGGATSPYEMQHSPFLATSPSMPGFQGGPGGAGGYFGQLPSPQQPVPHSPNGMALVGGGMPGTMMVEDDGSMLGPNPKSMRTQIKRTASNAGSHQLAMDAAQAINQQKRKSPGI